MKLKLTKEQRVKLQALEPVKIAGDGKCPHTPGEEFTIVKGLTLRVLEIRSPKGGGWSLRYELTDTRDRVLNLKRTPTIAKGEFRRIREGFDEAGYPSAPTAEAIKQAARESAYTAGSDDLDAGGAVDPDELAQINDRRRTLQNLWVQERRIIESSLKRLTVDPETRLAAQREIRALQRQLDALDRKLRSAA